MPPVMQAWKWVLVTVVLLSLIGCDSSSGTAPVQPEGPFRRTVSAHPVGEWSAAGGEEAARRWHTAARLEGGQVLGIEGEGRSAQLYEPSTGRFHATAEALNAHRGATATRLSNGRVLLVGQGVAEGGSSLSAELYEPSAQTWGPAGQLNTPRLFHTATLLPDGKVLVVGGAGAADGGSVLASCEVYEPSTGTWSEVSSLGQARLHHTATLLPNGRVLVVGGQSANGTLLSTAEVYEPTTGNWSPVETMRVGRTSHTATLLRNGQVLVVGGGAADRPSSISAELFNPATGTWAATASMAKPRRFHTATLLMSGEVLVTGGSHEDTGVLASAELYSPESDSWSSAGNMAAARSAHTATLLQNGQVLVVGGLDNSQLASAELYTLGRSNAPPPPTPTDTIPPLPEGVATPFEDAVSFLYTGNNPVQVGVAPGTLEIRRLAVLRGKVLTRDGTPLSGVAVTVLDHSEFGSTRTRVDGLFDMAVNGGGPLTVQYQKEGYLPSQRQVVAPWRDYASLPDVVLIPLDAQVTEVDTSGGSTTIQVAQGSPVTDSAGNRQATLLIAPATQATVSMPDGTTQPLYSLHMRATEYTVGDRGPQAMPGELPANSGYTYAVELSVDEALAAGATVVSFNQPVVFYVDNVLGFAVGGAVPAGYYDRQAGAWKASDNGRIVGILSTDGGLAQLDITGDGVADEGEALTSLGITDEERRKLATLYSAGKSLWRIPLTHFTPWDFNWPYGFPEDALPPEMAAPDGAQPVDKPECQAGSIIECQTQVLGEAVPVTGTPFTLHYRSDRVPGHKAYRTLRIPLSGPSLPPSVQSVVVEFSVAGRRFSATYAPQANLVHEFAWDGKDAYGRTVQGSVQVVGRTGYVYPLQYQTPAQISRSFARLSGAVMSAQRTTRTGILWQPWKSQLGSMHEPARDMGGWRLNIHHMHEPSTGYLYEGAGSRRYAGTPHPIVSTVAQPPFPEDLAVGPDGSVYVADGGGHRVVRYWPDGSITYITEPWRENCNGQPCYRGSPRALAVSSEGSLYVADLSRQVVLRVHPNGQSFERVAGVLYQSGFSGDDGPAVNAKLSQPYGIALAPDGGLYIADRVNNRIRYVDTQGIITTVVGTGAAGFGGDNGPALQATLDSPAAVALGPDGSLYIADMHNFRIRRVSPSGIISTVVGTGTSGDRGDGGPGVEARVGWVWDLEVDAEGKLLFTDYSNNRIRQLLPSGLLVAFAGRTISGAAPDEDGAVALQARIQSPRSLGIAPDGSIYVAERSTPLRMRRIHSALPSLGAGTYAVASSDGGQVYVFNLQGRHLRTLEALTRATVYEFIYDAQGRLVAIRDAAGLTTQIERDATGVPQAIVAPHGQRTRLILNAEGYLSSLTNPAGESTSFGYSAGGLLTSLTDARQGVHTYEYDALGLLKKDTNPGGGFKALTRTYTDAGVEVALSTALGRTTRYLTQRLPTKEEQRTTTLPTGAQTLKRLAPNGTTTVISADGTLFTTQEGPDPRFGMQVPLTTSSTVKLPSGLTMNVSQSRTITRPAQGSPLEFLTLQDTLRVNSRIFTSTYDATTRKLTTVSPLGRSTITTLDEQGRVVRAEAPGLLPMEYTYDTEGRLSTVTQGTRSSTFTYNAEGYLDRLTDALSRSTSFSYDLAGRPTLQVLSGERQVGMSYDSAGNLTALTPPGQPAHHFSYTPRDELERYSPPAGAPPVPPQGFSTAYHYDVDGALTEQSLPDGSTLRLTYNPQGQLASLQTPRTTITPTYATSGQLLALADSARVNLAYTYDGFLPKSTIWSGAISGTVSYTYNNDLRLYSTSVNSSSAVFIRYDEDGKALQVGSLQISREPSTGLLKGTTLGSVITEQTPNGYGELESHTATFNTTPLFSESLARDESGRITQRMETLDGTSHTYEYAYDEAGRLARVTLDGTPASTYRYDNNGNRTAVETSNGTLNATYDAQDRLLTLGSTSYTFGPNGDLQARQRQGETSPTFHQYDAVGNLVSVALPNGTRLEYLVDAQNRRVGKKVNGVLVQGFLYDGQLRVIAELDGNNRVVSRFVYATRGHVPDYLMKSGTTYRIVSDYLGSPRLVVNTTTGAIAQRLEYDVWGNVLSDSSPGFQPFGFAGGLYDRDTQFTRFGARDYDTETGRWAAKDPIRFQGGDSNLYAYVGNDPINFLDRNGLWAASVGFGGVAWFFLGGEASIQLAFDDDFNVALQGSVGERAGIGGGLGGSGFFTVNVGADTVHDLEGTSVNLFLDMAEISLGVGASVIDQPNVCTPDGANEGLLRSNGLIGPALTIGGKPATGISLGAGYNGAYTKTLIMLRRGSEP